MIPSLYARKGPGLSLAPLAGQTSAETVVIGAGLTGISTALHLAEVGKDVVVLDTHEPGWGASGRNGGQVNPGLKTPPEQVLKDFGPTIGARLVDNAWNAPDLVFDLIARHSIDCDAARGGTIRAATASSQLDALRELTRQCENYSGPATWLTAADMMQRTGASVYAGGMIDARGGQIDPLAYTRGLAKAAISAGARIHDQSRVRSVVRRGTGWAVATDRGEVVAQSVVMATNGYSGRLLDKMRRSIIPLFSAIVATEPLPGALRAKILAKREVVYELGEITTYYRVDAQGRFLMGGRSASHDLHGPDAFPYLKARALKLWPELKTIQWTSGWNGQLAMTLDHYPHYHEPARGLVACLGYNGRGVAMATLMGQNLADVLQGGEPLFPAQPIKPVPLHFGWKAGVIAGIVRGRLKDRFGL
ncbi:NAD(P)/FAD-dependent oxidoreductase [Gluconobacter frateurii]|uniref:Glycine/D-amino acid oxidase n=1 Tax=Gluconobacter frateurii NRIC 0228 TaxID=1307946 RepID=A0ABQ0QFI4_9PROT|nr:FAD-binding oxidoreductase [Gluconobacter frateurii]GBR17093.1 glycine/D-amino acid oxidase [Gluconobacter frateurii NRIC 0228]GLP90745.1 oxidoreductase [Gluconobacter frateurii]